MTQLSRPCAGTATPDDTYSPIGPRRPPARGDSRGHSRSRTGRILPLVASALIGALLNAPGPASADPLAVVVTRDATGRVSRIVGPGISVERQASLSAAGVAPTRSELARETQGRERSLVAARRRLDAPIVCHDGERREISDVEVVVDSAGIVARRGCTLRISGVEVRAGGWGLVIEDGASVRVDASIIEGRTGSVDASPGAAFSAWSTVFRGPAGRALRAPQFIDRGGNAWD